MKLDLLVVIRCHAKLDFVIDTYQAAKYCLGEGADVVFAVDATPTLFASKMVEIFGANRVYCAPTNCGWGAGLYTLLVESIKYFKRIYEFSHLQSIDYDTLYIGADGARAILDQIDQPTIGLLGCHNKNNEHWKAIFKKTRKQFEKVFGVVSDSYITGEGCQGGYMTLTQAALQAMECRGMFHPPYSVAKRYTSIADDHLLPIFVRMCGLTIKDVSSFARCSWRAREDPRGIERKGYKVFHPVKLTPKNENRSTEIEVRNYFRTIRGAPDRLR